MARTLRLGTAAVIILVQLSATSVSSQNSTKSTPAVSITEPVRYALDELYKTADIVALVKVLSGDTEHYDVAVYKGEIVEAFKGASAKQTLYFGPFIGERLGSEYVLFLHKSSSDLSPKFQGQLSYGTVPYAAVFHEGYTSMEMSYQCVFNGKQPKEQCDDAVRVCTDYVKLPKSVPVAPPLSEATRFGCRWARKDNFMKALQAMKLAAR